jgi:hypothetical protein
MKPGCFSGIGTLFAALLIVGAIFVPAVSATESNQEDIRPSGGDPVDRDVMLDRSPHLFDGAGNRLGDREISRMIEEVPAVSHLDGMDEGKNRELAEILRQLHKYRSIAGSITPEISSKQPAFAELDLKHLKAALNKRELVTVTLGGLPFSKSGKSASLSDLENFTTAIGDQIRERYLYPNGSLIGFGYATDGYLRVRHPEQPAPAGERLLDRSGVCGAT